MELTVFMVGESRNHAAEHGLMFDSFKDANEWAEENDLNVYKAVSYINPDEMYEVENEDD